ncbi:MAG: PglZ domain-containing protein [Saprospiraceae bacterium]|jgi:CheY-like chemotaxis protein|nr:PglZ domain-containing protein [Saprospiraceae bacterium]MBP9209721.1 PglZ domain-containing protein [Saprospiraceae bacterium]MBV6474104.1 Regulator of RpoS [Saprospiraceae bacterium]
MDKIRILWVDDEIDSLKPQIFFLEKKGHYLETCTNGHDALAALEKNPGSFDLVFLDESMPGITGLETLARMREAGMQMPAVLVTKNEAENIMDDAIGSQIADYLIKPVNPNQLVLTIKKLIENKRLVSEKTTSHYQSAFRELAMEINGNPDYTGWVDIYKKLIQWELRFEPGTSSDMAEILSNQKYEANNEFCKYISGHYLQWMQSDKVPQPIWSHQLFAHKVFPLLRDDAPTIFLLLDNLRYDQWKVIEPLISERYQVADEDAFFAILPTTTQYSRNAIFAGMLPAEIESFYPDWWLNDNEEGGKNLKEPDLLAAQIRRTFRKEIRFDYVKILNSQQGKQLLDNIHNYLRNHLTVIVYNFIDMLSHARTEMEVLKELAADEKAYRSLTRSWFTHSPLWAALQRIADQDVQIILTTDHGTIRVKNPSKVAADRDTTTNLRYKVGKNLNYEKRDVVEIKDPPRAGLPRPNLSSAYIFARNDTYFLYPNNYSYYLNYYRNTFQHGGVSMEEMICPVVRLHSKK